MHRYILKRIVLLIPVLIAVSFIVFLLVSLAPGDAITATVGNSDLSEQQKEELREYYGLNDTVFVQYFRYMKNFIRGDMGYSIAFKEQVSTLYFQRFPATLALAGVSVFFALLFAIPLGILSALKADTVADNVITVVALFGISMPMFWIALVMILFFSLRLGWFPAGEFKGLKSLILPGLTGGIMFMGALMRQTRSSMLDCLNADYLRTARSKGVSKRDMVTVHAFRNALIPIVTTAGAQLGILLGGSAVTEAVFNWPGVGRLIVSAINNMDTPLICGCVIMQTIMISVVMLLVDILYAFIDPRIKAKYAKGGKG